MENVTTSSQKVRHLQLLADCWHAAGRNMKGTRYIGWFDITEVFVYSPIDELIVLIPPVRTEDADLPCELPGRDRPRVLASRGVIKKGRIRQQGPGAPLPSSLLGLQHHGSPWHSNSATPDPDVAAAGEHLRRTIHDDAAA